MLDRRKKLPFISGGFGEVSLRLNHHISMYEYIDRPPKSKHGFPVRPSVRPSANANGIVSPLFLFVVFFLRTGCGARLLCGVPGSVVKRSRLDGGREQNRSTNRGRRGGGRGEGGQTVQSESRFNWTAFLCDPRRLRRRERLYYWLPRRRRRRLKNKRLGPPSRAPALLRLCSPPKLLVTDPSL